MSDGPFKVGDIVELKSGGPPMTVIHVSTNMVGHSVLTCQWFFGSMQTAMFRQEILIPSKPKKFEELKGVYSPSPADSIGVEGIEDDGAPQ
jgi:uncharacterized protein YodC (DUF2158 family)